MGLFFRGISYVFPGVLSVHAGRITPILPLYYVVDSAYI